MDKIIMNNMAFFARHGAWSHEKRIGQKFYADAVLFLDLQPAGESDNLSDTADYGEVYATIRQVIEGESYNLIEAAAETACADVLAAFPAVETITLTLKKPQAPVGGIMDYFAVEITRKRGE